MRFTDSPEAPLGNVPSRSRSRLLPFAISAFCLIFVWLAWRNYSSFNWVRFAETFEILRPGWLLLGLVISASSFLVRAARWRVMMQPPRCSFRGIVLATYVGFSAVALFGRAGEFVRPYLIARRAHSTIAAQAGIWALERFYDFVVILLLFGIGITRARHFPGGAGSRVEFVLHGGGWIAIGAAILAGSLFYLMAHHPDLCRKRLNEATSFLPPEYQARLLDSLDRFLGAVAPAAQWPMLLKSLACTAAEWGTILGAIWCYFRAFPPTSSFSILDVAAYFGFTAFGAILQLPGIGGGLQIASVVILTELFRIALEQALGFSLLIWAGTSMVVLPFGIPLALQEGLTLGKLRRLGRDAAL